MNEIQTAKLYGNSEQVYFYIYSNENKRIIKVMPEEQIIVENIEDLINKIKEQGEIEEIKIAIDGWLGTGKTETAKAIAEEFELGHIECDKYWKEHSREYAENMEYEKLEEIKEDNKLCIEGIVMLQMEKEFPKFA